MKKILLTGVTGQVGRALQQYLAQFPLAGWQVVACDRQQMDLTAPEHIRTVVREVAPALIIHPAAYTAVDQAESESALAFAINATAPKVLAEEAARLKAGMIHFSTDYVYDGTKASVYVETDKVNPMSVYGASKLAGEDAIRQVGLPHLILRTSWVYGADGKNFLKTILRLAHTRESMRIVSDQHGAPTSDASIAQAVRQLLDVWEIENTDHTGVYHLVNRGETSWFGFASAIVDKYQQLAPDYSWPALAVKEIAPIAAAEYPTPAKRPSNSKLSTEKLAQTFGVMLPAWQESLDQVMHRLTPGVNV